MTKAITPQRQIRLWEDNFLRCRDLGHTWGQEIIDDSPRRNTGLVNRELMCSICTTVRIDKIDYPGGDVVGRRYIYPEGYLAPKGQFKRGDLRKPEIRAEHLRRFLNAR